MSDKTEHRTGYTPPSQRPSNVFSSALPLSVSLVTSSWVSVCELYRRARARVISCREGSFQW